MSDTVSLLSAMEFPDIVQGMSTVGIFAVDRRMNVLLWNRFMEVHSQLRAESVLGRNLLDCFPELNGPWIQRKIKGVMVLRNHSFTSWRERSYLLKFPNVRSITSGHADFMYQDCSFWPLKDITGQVRGVCVSIHDVTEMALTQKLLEHATDEALSLEESSQRDSLTGLFNRGFFDEQISHEMARVRRYEWEMALIMLDVDHFKQVNDTYGHPVGDKVLQVVSTKMIQQLRTSDTLCRYGGEEFSVILPHVNREKALQVAERLRQAVASEEISIDDHGHTFSVSISIGLALLQEGMSPGKLIECADKALYQAKDKGRNRVELYQGS